MASDDKGAEDLSPALIHVSTPLLVLTTVPLLFIAWISWWLELHLESPLVVGMFRTFAQLSVLGFILEPIFIEGKKWWWLVLAYTCFMIVLATHESARRAKYHFHGMFWFVFGIISVNVTLVALFAFGIILRPDPLWEPQYVIPIIGMLLGNTINGVALSLNGMLTALVDSSLEVELYLSYGATSYEASGRLLREAVRTSATPGLNGMAIIGLISIPGMMTGQILGGSPVNEAARYQILITYFIAICSFGSILTVVTWIVRFLFDKNCTLRTDRLTKRLEKPSFLKQIDSVLGWSKQKSSRRQPSASLGDPSSGFDSQEEENRSYVSPLTKEGLSVVNTLSHSTNSSGRRILLEAYDLSCSLEWMSSGRDDVIEERILEEIKNDAEESPLMAGFCRRFLFQELELQVSVGEIALVTGPSGVGKSTLLRILAGLTSSNDGKFRLGGNRRSAAGPYRDMTVWRQHVRYVAQSKLDIPGTPGEFLQRIASLQVWKKLEVLQPSSPSPQRLHHHYHQQQESVDAKVPLLLGPASTRYERMKAMTLDLVQSWGMNSSCIDSEWKTLSGGESQRVHLAMAMASQPKVLLLDESTSALDVETKIRVEKSIAAFCTTYGVGTLWITHDIDQIDRLTRAASATAGQNSSSKISS